MKRIIDNKEVEVYEGFVDSDEDIPQCPCCDVQPETEYCECCEDAVCEPKKEDENLEEVTPRELNNEQRKIIIDEYNKTHPESYIEYDKPTPEEVKEIADLYTKTVTEFNAKKFTIADKNNALRVAKFLEKWNENDAQWEGDGWRGTVFFDVIIKEFIEKFKMEEQDLVIDYPTLIYLHTFMLNYRGVGLKGAMKFSKIAEEYNKILETVCSEFDKHNKEGEGVKNLMNRWRSYENGFKLKYKEIPEESSTGTAEIKG